MKKLILSAVLILFAWPATEQKAAAQSSSDIFKTETFDTGSSPEVNIRTSGGKIEVRGHDDNFVTVEMYVQRRGQYLSPSDTDLSDYEINISQRGNTITASAERKDDGVSSWFRGSTGYSISFVVKTPAGSAIDGRTSGGSIVAENLSNKTNMRTSGGSVKAKEISGTADFRTSGGSISLEEVQGDVEARTSGGTITASNIRGNADLRTSGGSIRIAQSSAKLNARTSGGSIRADLLELTDDVNFRTSGGSIRISIPPVEHFNLNLSGSRVNTEIQNFTGSMDRSSVKGKIGNGGPEIYARTSGGSVTLSRQ